MKNRTKITLALTVVALMVVTMVFSGCMQKESYDFTPLTGDTSGEVLSNGGLAVSKGNYIYYVNGLASKDMNNTFGTPVYGAIMRILKTDLDEVLSTAVDTESIELTEAEEAAGLTLAKKALALAQEMVKQKAETLVPKMLYTANTSAKGSNGIFIYKDRLYYTSPSTTWDRDGAIESSKLQLLSCKLDGTDTQVHYLFNSNSSIVTITETSNSVYAMFSTSQGDIHCFDLVSGKDKVVAKDAETGVFDYRSGYYYYVNTDGDIYGGLAGEDATKLVENTSAGYEKVAYTMVSSYGGVLCYKKVSTVDISSDGVYIVSVANPTAQKLMSFVPSSYFYFDGNVYLTSTTASGLYSVIRYNPENPEDIGYMANSKSAISFIDVDKTGIVVSTGSEIQRIIYNEEEGKYVESKLAASTGYTSGWGITDYCDGYTFQFNSKSISYKIGEENGKDVNATIYTIDCIKGNGSAAHVNIQIHPADYVAAEEK